MQGNRIPANGGTWLRYDAFGPPLAAYAADLTSGPISILWKGAVDVVSLQKFFADAAHEVSPREKVLYRTWVSNRTDHDVVESLDAPPLGRLAENARFIRFECALTTESDASAQDREANPVLIAWAVLDEPEKDTQESIGVYFRREDLPVILPRIESLVIGTAVSKSFPRNPNFAPTRSEQTRHALWALRQDLA